MTLTQSILLAVLGLISLGALLALLRCRALIRGICFFLITGLGSLGAVDLAGIFTGVTIAVNPLSLGIAAVLGLPGVVGMLALRLICGL